MTGWFIAAGSCTTAKANHIFPPHTHYLSLTHSRPCKPAPLCSAGTKTTDTFEMASTRDALELADTVVCVLNRSLGAEAPVKVCVCVCAMCKACAVAAERHLFPGVVMHCTPCGYSWGARHGQEEFKSHNHCLTLQDLLLPTNSDGDPLPEGFFQSLIAQHRSAEDLSNQSKKQLIMLSCKHPFSRRSCNAEDGC